MLVSKGRAKAGPLTPAAEPSEIRPADPENVELYMIETDKRRRIALTRELRGFGINVRPFAAPSDFLEALPEFGAGCVTLSSEALRPGSPQLAAGESVLAQACPTIITYDRLELSEALRLVRMGALDFLRTPFALEELQAVLRRAAPRIRELRRLGEWSRARAALDALSVRERAVLDGLAEGLSSKILARRLKLSPRTVDMHRGRISRKLGVSSLAALLSIAFAAGQADAD